MTPAPHDRRSHDRPHPLSLAQTFGPWALGVLAFLGGRITSPGDRLRDLELEQRAGIVRDSLSILDRVALTGAVSLIGRERCLEDMHRATERGYPCTALVNGNGWPLLHGPRGASASVAATAVADRVQTAARTPAFVAVALLAPFAVAGRGQE